MKTTDAYRESYQPKQGFGARLLFCAFLLCLIGLSKAFAQVPVSPLATAASNLTCTSFEANWGSVSGATAYYLDVCTDNTFTTFVATYNNLNTGIVTTHTVTGLLSFQNYFYRVRAENGNGTSLNSNTIAVIMAPVITATPSSQTICSGDSTVINLSSTDPNSTYAWTVTQSGVSGAAPGSGNFIQQALANTGSASGSVDFIITNNNGCAGNTVVVTVSVLNCGQSFSYPSATFCQSGLNPTPTINITGGTFSSTPAGLSLDSSTGTIDLASSAVGTYSLVYTHGGVSDAITFTIGNTTPDATFSYGAYLYDPSATNPLPFFGAGASAGSFLGDVGLVVDANTGEIDLSTSTAGQHNIYNTIPQSGSCATAADYDTVFIAPEAGCSAFLLENGPFSQTYNCLTDSAELFSFGFHYFGLSAGTTTAFVNWGDGTTETYAITQPAGDGFIFLDADLHLYSSPGVYTVFCIFTNLSACHNDTVVSIIDIGNNCSNLSGTVYSDDNTNCSLESGTDIGIANQLITATDASNNVYYAWTDYTGNYAFNALPNGVYVVDLAYLNSGYSITCSGAFPQTITINNNSVVANCAVTCGGTFDAAITGISLWNGFFPGQADGILPHVGILNQGCSIAGISGQVKIVLDACIQYTGTPSYSAAGAPDAVITASTGDTLVWNVSDISNIGTFGYFDYAVNTLTCTSAQVGDSACITMMILPTNGDADPSNNTFTRCFEIGVSYDPNNKEVIPAGIGSEGFIPADEPFLTYTLNFQNTGTATAWNIYVMDTIDADLDLNSIEILSASHRMQIYTLPNRAVKFMFADIMLVDSTHNERLSHGYVTFRIKPNPGLAPGTEIENTGHIYFDYNDPIVTNTTLNTIEMPSSVKTFEKSTVVRVYPNPAKESVTVFSNSNAAGTITVTDVLGKMVKEVKTNSEKTVVNTADLQNGVYFIRLTQDNMSKTEKIMITK
ncbi:MAG: T9SS type A sorting domain-containing protein [Bacteroidota bacterium]